MSIVVQINELIQAISPSKHPQTRLATVILELFTWDIVADQVWDQFDAYFRGGGRERVRRKIREIVLYHIGDQILSQLSVHVRDEIGVQTWDKKT